MNLRNATYEELLNEIHKRVEYSPNQRKNGLDSKITSIAQKRFLIMVKREIILAINRYPDYKENGDAGIDGFYRWLYKEIGEMEREILDIEKTL